MSVDLTNPEFGFQVGHAARIHRDMMGSQGPQCIELMCRVLVADNDDIEEVRLAYLRLFENAPKALKILMRLGGMLARCHADSLQFGSGTDKIESREIYNLVAEVTHESLGSVGWFECINQTLELTEEQQQEMGADPTQPSPYSA